MKKTIKFALVLFFLFASSNVFAQKDKFYNVNRFNFDIKINQYPQCLGWYPTRILDIDIAKTNPVNSLGVGCIDFLENFNNTVSPKGEEANKEKDLLAKAVIPFSFEFSNRISFAKLGASKAHHNFIYWGTDIAYTNIVEYLYRGNLAINNSVGIVFPILSTNPSAYKNMLLPFKQASNINFNLILELGLGFNYAFFGGDYAKKKDNFQLNRNFIDITPTFSLMYNISFKNLPDFEIESGIRIMPALRIDTFVRMQYDFYKTNNGTKIGISGLFDLWGFSGGLGLAVRY